VELKTQIPYLNINIPKTPFICKSLSILLVKKRSHRQLVLEDAVLSDLLLRFIENLSQHKVCISFGRAPELQLKLHMVSYIELLDIRIGRAFKTVSALKY